MAPELEEAPPELLIAQKKAENMFTAVRDRLLGLNLPFAGTPLPDGSVAQYGSGDTLLPSPTEMRDLGALISLGLSSWIQSGKLPTASAMLSSAQSMEVDPVVFITTLYLLAHAGAFLPVICSGDLGTVTSILDHLTSVEEQPITSQSTSSKATRRRALGDSTIERRVTASTKSTSKNGKPDTSVIRPPDRRKRTKSASRKRKKKARK